MGNKYITIVLFFFFISISLIGSNAIANVALNIDSTKSHIKLKDSRPNRPKFESFINKDFESFMIKVSAIKASSTNAPSKLPVETKSTTSSGKTIINANANVEPQKNLENVKIFPNPVSTQINLTFTLIKEDLVTVKVLDVLGNEVATLLSQKLAAGEQTNTFSLNSKLKLNSGLYFVRIAAGPESIIKRISVL